MKKVLILGSSGYIGSYLVNGLKNKHKVIAHSRKKIINKDFNKGIFKKIHGDIRNKSTLEKIIKSKPECIIYTISTGIGVWGLNKTVGWAWDITNFVWWVGIGHAGTLISAVLLLFRQKWRMAINRSAEAMTI